MQRLLRGLMTPVLAGVVLGILAPFHTGGFRPVLRFTYWISLTLAGGLGAVLAQILLMRVKPQIMWWTSALVQSVGATLAVAPFVIGLNGHINLSAIGLSLFYIWVISIVIASVGELVRRQSQMNDGPQIESPPPRAPIFDRLPPKFREATLYAITSEDHYIRIYSDVGEHMMLMRLADAEALASPLPGLKPHRSWWVTEAGVNAVNRNAGKMSLILHDGSRVPVSRSGAKAVKAAGWV